jgi:cation diffusion facilitator CzcD-associated flavoprotein CzcO
MPAAPEADVRHVEIAIAGAGFSGLGMAIALRREGRDDFVVLERATDLGGTWRDNSYPGCACDIPSVLYSYSDQPKPDWTHAYARQPEIWVYLQNVAASEGVDPHMRYDHEVLSADWDEGRQRWAIETTQGRFTADVLISAVGALADPSIPDLPGIDEFGGNVFHSARWDHDDELAGRRVAVIGTGASAIQFVPEIQPVVGHLDLFQRTPPWVLPRGNPEIPARWRRRLRRSPRLLALARRAVFLVQEATHFGFRHPRAMTVVERRTRAHIAREIGDPGLAAKLTPNYSLGCKRVLGSNAWYPALRAENVEVVTDGIERVTVDGILDTHGVHHPADTIIFGTGFQVTDPPISHRLRGRGGVLLADSWRGSPKAHLGIGVSGFPNLFMLLGPNTGLGHNSVLLMIEAQTDYVRQALAYRRAQGLATLEPTPAAQAGFLAEVDRDTQGTVWTAGGCSSWYLDETGRNSALWPESVRAYQRRIAVFTASDYDTELPRHEPEPIGEPALA